MSTSKKIEKAKGFLGKYGNALFIITLDFTNHEIWTISRNAAFIEAITQVKGEEEVIFPSGTIFTIDKVAKKDKIYEIMMTVEIY